jgi:hypothetical protein
VPGYLATITSAAENAFINSAFNSGLAEHGAWIGGYEPADDGISRWMDGSEAGSQFSDFARSTAPFYYANWGGIEPNNPPPFQNFLWMNIGAPFPGVGSAEWANSILSPNIGDPVVGYIVEYSPALAADAIIWHQPLARNGASEDTDPSAGRTVKYRFKRGSTIPINVQALGCTGNIISNANVIGSVAVFGDSSCAGANDAGTTPIDFNGVGGSGGVMSKVDDYLKYNLNTRSLPTTTQCYILRVTLTDISTGEEAFEEVLLQAK